MLSPRVRDRDAHLGEVNIPGVALHMAPTLGPDSVPRPYCPCSGAPPPPPPPFLPFSSFTYTDTAVNQDANPSPTKRGRFASRTGGRASSPVPSRFRPSSEEAGPIVSLEGQQSTLQVSYMASARRSICRLASTTTARFTKWPHGLPLQALESQLECVICQEWMLAPHSLVPCGHMYCGGCLYNLLRCHQSHHSPTCPHCRCEPGSRCPLLIIRCHIKGLFG